jgi:hypothetical protein
MVDAVKNCRNAGIHGNCTWIMAYPGEELKHLQTSVELSCGKRILDKWN